MALQVHKKTAGPLRVRETMRQVAVSLSADRRSVIISRFRLIDPQFAAARKRLSTNCSLGKEKEPHYPALPASSPHICLRHRKAIARRLEKGRLGHTAFHPRLSAIFLRASPGFTTVTSSHSSSMGRSTVLSEKPLLFCWIPFSRTSPSSRSRDTFTSRLLLPPIKSGKSGIVLSNSTLVP